MNIYVIFASRFGSVWKTHYGEQIIRVFGATLKFLSLEQKYLPFRFATVLNNPNLLTDLKLLK